MEKLQERCRLALAKEIAESLCDELRQRDCCLCAVVAGSIRRKCRLVGDIDIVFVDRNLEPGKGSIEKIEYKQMPVQIYHCSYRDYESMLLFLTGSKQFNIRTRYQAKVQGLRLSQYGLMKGDIVVAMNEESILDIIGVDEMYINPVNRVR